MRWIKKIVFVLLVLAGLLAILASLGQYYFENEVKQYVKTSLNNVLAAPIDVNEINFSLLQKFPNASVSFEEVLAWDAFPSGKNEDTLFYADRIFLEFNLFDILNKNYVLREIEIVKADIRLKWNKAGEPNYIIWKEQEEGDKKLNMSLEKVKIKDSKLLIDHMKSAFISSYNIGDLSLAGNLQDKVLNLYCKAKLNAFKHITDDFSYGSTRELALETNFLLDLDAKSIGLTNALIDWNGVKSNATGAINYGNDEYHFDFDGKDQSLGDIIGLLPPAITSSVEEYSLSSKVDFIVETGNKQQDDWKSIIEFKGRDGKMTHIPSTVSAKELNYSGKISIYKGNTSINLDAFSGVFSGGKFNGKLSIVNLEHPRINAELKGSFELAELIPFIKNDAITNPSGSLIADLQFNGSFYDPKNIQKKEIEKAITTGSIDLDQIAFNLDKLNLELRELSGRFILNDNDAAVENLSAKWKGSQVELSGTIRNLMPFILLEDQRLSISAIGSFDQIDLENLLTSSEKEGQQESFEIPSYLRVEIDATIGEIRYKKFLASDIKGHFIIQNSKLLSDNFQFATAGGRVNSYLMLTSSSGGDLSLEVQGRLENMAINTLFYEFENMGQSIITDQNISGLLNADVMFKGTWDKTLELDLSSIKVLADVKVDNGQLKDLKSLEQIGDYLRENAIASAFVDTKGLSKKLKNIRFDQLQNQIEIKNKVIYIPEMQILSDAVDINLSGKHGFNNSIDYAMNFRLREIMKQVKETEFGIIEDDGLGSRIFLKMTGTATNPIFALDKQAKKEYKKEAWSEEKKNINTLLKEEFGGLFGGEKEGKNEGEAKKYTIEWDEDPDSTEIGKGINADSSKIDKKGKTLIFQTDEDIRDSDDDDY